MRLDRRRYSGVARTALRSDFHIKTAEEARVSFTNGPVNADITKTAGGETKHLVSTVAEQHYLVSIQATATSSG